MPENEKAETKKSGKEKAETKKDETKKPKDRNQNQPRHIPQTKAI